MSDNIYGDYVIKIKYFADIPRLRKFPSGDWCDLYCAEDVSMKAGEFRLIHLGVGMKIPFGFESHVVPRSSTYKRWGIIQANGMGVLDNSYCGPDDEWMFPAIALKDTHINKGDRICQFRIERNQPSFVFEEVTELEGESRGGFGSTGV